MIQVKMTTLKEFRSGNVSMLLLWWEYYRVFVMIFAGRGVGGAFGLLLPMLLSVTGD